MKANRKKTNKGTILRKKVSTIPRKIKIERAAKDFAVRFEGVMRDLAKS